MVLRFLGNVYASDSGFSFEHLFFLLLSHPKIELKFRHTSAEMKSQKHYCIASSLTTNLNELRFFGIITFFVANEKSGFDHFSTRKTVWNIWEKTLKLSFHWLHHSVNMISYRILSIYNNKQCDDINVSFIYREQY